MKALVIVTNGLLLGFRVFYGNDWISTPALDRLASEGIVFDQHYADRPDLPGARQAWRTGCYRFPRPEGEVVMAAPTHELISLLRGQGVTTSLVMAGSQSSTAEFAALWELMRM